MPTDLKFELKFHKIENTKKNSNVADKYEIPYTLGLVIATSFLVVIIGCLSRKHQCSITYESKD